MSDIRFQCRHIHVSGHRCGSPSLRGEIFCYHHHTTRKPIAKTELDQRRGHQSTFTLPEPEDRAAIQLALGEIIRRIAAGDLDPKRAGLLLYALQIASCNLPKSAAAPAETVEDITLDETHGPIAPEAEFHRKPQQKGLEQILLEQWDRDAEEERQRRQQSQPGVIALQAVAADQKCRKARVAAWKHGMIERVGAADPSSAPAQPKANSAPASHRQTGLTRVHPLSSWIRVPSANKPCTIPLRPSSNAQRVKSLRSPHDPLRHRRRSRSRYSRRPPGRRRRRRRP